MTMTGAEIWLDSLFIQLPQFVIKIASIMFRTHCVPAVWLSMVVSIGLSISLEGYAEATTNDAPIRGVNMRLLPYQGTVSTTPTGQIIRVNDARMELAQRAGFNLVRVGVPMDPWIEQVSTVKQDKTLQLLRAVVSTALRRNLSVDVVLFAPARQIVCEGQNRDPYRAGLNAVLAELPDRSDFGIEVLNEPPSCPKPSSASASWEATQEDLYRTVRSMKRHLFFVVAGARWGAADGLLRLDPDLYGNDPNTMFTFHYYEPLLYTHQEVAWLRADHLNKFVSDLAWPVESTNMGQVREDALARLSDDKTLDDSAHSEGRKTLLRLFAEYATQGTTGYMSSRFQAVADWAGAHNLSTRRILLGEFGVHREMPAPNLVAEPWPTASLWLSQVRSAAESRQMGWVVWDLDSGFGVICGSQAEMGELCPSYRTLFAE